MVLLVDLWGEEKGGERRKGVDVCLFLCLM